MSGSTVLDAPRFALGQPVRVIANHGGLYAAQIGVVGIIARQRTKRRYGYRSYNVSYQDAKGSEKVVIVREDDLEAVADGVTESPTPAQPADTPAPPDALFQLGQRVTVHPPADGLEDEYPSFTHYPIVGEIASACQVTAGGVHCYDVKFPRIERGVSTECWPPVSIREAHLLPEPSQVGWLASSAASTKTASDKPITPMPEPKFSVGDHVAVDSRSDLCYETWARKGAIGEIREIGRPVRGVRRYTVRYHSPRIGVHETRIREEHLLKVEPPAPRQYAKARHAYEYRDEHPRGEHLWCDAAGCFIEDCAICRAYLGDTLTAPTTAFACARGRGGSVTCQHTWQVWPDGRYRHCPKCKASERVVAVTAESEVAR